MYFLDWFALLILILIGVWLVVLFCFLAMLPGRIATERKHVYSDAIAIGGWLSLLMGGFLWPFVLVWAYMSNPAPAEQQAQQPANEPGGKG
ncbi:MAG: DUF3302 domain-containing protein [Rhizobiaceae bacterium]